MYCGVEHGMLHTTTCHVVVFVFFRGGRIGGEITFIIGYFFPMIFWENRFNFYE